MFSFYGPETRISIWRLLRRTACTLYNSIEQEYPAIVIVSFFICVNLDLPFIPLPLEERSLSQNLAFASLDLFHQHLA
jgi:hypothetical protein